MGGEGDDRGWYGWMASPTQWTRVWVNSRSWWWTGRPSMLSFMGSQTVRHNWSTELNWTEKRNSVPIKQLLPVPLSPRPHQPPICFISLWIYLLQRSHISRIIHYVTFRVWIMSLHVFSRSIHVTACISTSLLFMTEWHLTVCLCYSLFTHLSVDGHLVYFLLLANMNSVALQWTCVYMYSSSSF